MTHSKQIITNLFKADRLTNRLRQVLGSVNGMIQRKLGRPLLKVIVLVPRVMGIRSSIYLIKVLLSFAKYAHLMAKRSGMRFTVIYLKACHTLLQQTVCGQRLSDTGPFGARVSRTRSGLPTCIPSQHRQEIRGGNKMIIRLWLSLFSLYRVIDIKGRVNLSTITSPSTADLGLKDEFVSFINYFYLWISGNWVVPGSITDSLLHGTEKFLSDLETRPKLISSSGPVLTGKGGLRLLSTSPLSLLLTSRVWTSKYCTALWNDFQEWCELTSNSWLISRVKYWSSGPENPIDKGMTRTVRGEIVSSADSPPYNPDKTSWSYRKFRPIFTTWNFLLGKLGFKLESAGKVRVFAMVDAFTQWLMEPLHEGIFLLLEVIPQDGTHNQVKPLERLLRRQSLLRERRRRPGSTLKRGTTRGDAVRAREWGLFSFDLSAATDRLPLVFQRWLLVPIIGERAAELWARLLTERLYLIPRRNDLGLPPGQVKYAAGQPMGALSSWAMLALTHHCIVQWAWFRVCSETKRDWTWYQDYAVLGDDVVIMGSSVAKAYLKIMRSLGVSVSDHKSLISNKGTGFEFAKRTFLDGESIGAVPLPELRVAGKSLPALLEVVRKYRLTLGQYLSFLGFGYRAKGKATQRLQNLPTRLRNYIVAYYSPSMPSFPGLVDWLSLRSCGNSYKAGASKVSTLVTTFIQVEKKAILASLERLSPLLAIVKELTDIYMGRDDRMTSFGIKKTVRIHEGIHSRISRYVLNSLDETVYYKIFKGVKESELEIRAKVAELDTVGVDGVQSLWDLVRKLESDLGALPLPRNLTLSQGEKPLLTEVSDLKRWKLYSRVFRSTKSG